MRIILITAYLLSPAVTAANTFTASQPGRFLGLTGPAIRPMGRAGFWPDQWQLLISLTCAVSLDSLYA